VLANADAVARAGAEISMAWASLAAHTLPEELSAALDAQRAASAAALAQKDALLATLRAAGAKKDVAFSAALADAKTSVDAVAARLRSLFTEARDVRKREIEAIEAAFVAERDALISAQRRELDGLSDARRQLEARTIEARTAAEDSHTHELYATQAAESAC
jgi:dynein regulatory complex protein 1